MTNITQLQSYLNQSKSFNSNFQKNKQKYLQISAAFLGALGGLDAQIVYSGVQNVGCALAGATNRCYANINNSGGNDFEFHRNHVGALVFIQVDEVIGGGFTINGFHALAAGGYAYPYANNANVTIGAAGPWAFNAGQGNTLSTGGGGYPNDQWTGLANETTRFIGIRGTVAGQTKYGWIRVTKNSFGNHTLVDWAYDNSGNSINTGATPKIGIGTTNPSNMLTVSGDADVSGKVAIGKATPTTNLDVEGGIRTAFSGSIVINVPSTGVQNLNLTIGSLPNGWTFDNTGVVVTNVDGSTGIIRQAKLTAANNIQLNYDAIGSGNTRFNYVIFKL